MEIKPENRRKGGVGFLSMLSLLFNFILFKIQLRWVTKNWKWTRVTIKLLGWVIRNEKWYKIDLKGVNILSQMVVKDVLHYSSI